MKYTQEQIAQVLAYADPVTAASIRARLILIHSLETLTTELRNSNEVIGGIIDDMSRSTAELKEAVDKL
jgi:hypothetical protein